MHQNPTGYWKYEGSYSVLLTDDAPTDRVPSGTRVSEKTIYVKCGQIHQAMGRIEFYVEEQLFFWRYSFIKEIRSGAGKLIWRNSSYKG